MALSSVLLAAKEGLFSWKKKKQKQETHLFLAFPESLGVYEEAKSGSFLLLTLMIFLYIVCNIQAPVQDRKQSHTDMPHSSQGSFQEKLP